MSNSLNKIFYIYFFVLLLAPCFGKIFAQGNKIALLYSGYTESFSALKSPKIIDEITLWEIFLMENKIPYNVIYDKDLESGIEDDYNILILPSVNVISNAEINSIMEFLNKGNSVLSVGSKLNVSKDELFVGDENQRKVFGISCKEYFTDDQITDILDLNSLLTEKNIKKGILHISAKYQPLICDNNSSCLKLDYMKAEDIPEESNLILYGSANGGRFVWLGFNFGDVAGAKEDVTEFKNLLINSLSWLNKKPDLMFSMYPDNFNGVSVFILQNSPNLSTDFVSKLKQEGITPGLQITLDEKISKKIIDEIDNENYILDLSMFSIPDEKSKQDLINKIRNYSNELETNIKNVLVSETLIDDKTFVNLLRENGVEFILYWSNYSGIPAIVDNKYLTIPYNSGYENNIIGKNVNFVFYRFQYDCDKKNINEYFDRIEQVKRSNNWITTLSDLKNWWMRKNNLFLNINSTNSEKYTVDISNNNDSAVNKLNLIINFPNPGKLKNLTIVNDAGIEDYSLDKASQLNIRIDKLNPHQSKRINIEFSTE